MPDATRTSRRRTRRSSSSGGGPNRIGQGIEFDYCCVHAVFAAKEAGYEAIMINSNPETVSTDYDTSDKLYFEPLTREDVLNIVEQEKPEGVIVQFGGQTPLNLAVPLEKAGVTILGTSPDSIDRAEDRKRFQELVKKLGLIQPHNGTATSFEEARAVAGEIGYPVVVRALLRPGRPGDGDRLRRGRPGAVHAEGDRSLAGAPDAHRQVPGGCHRGRRGLRFPTARRR